jgi:hypothetical protein
VIVELYGVVTDASVPAGTIPRKVPTRQDLLVPRGEALTVRLTVYKQDHAVKDLTGCTLKLGLRQFRDEEAPRLTREATLTTPISGQAEVELLPADTFFLSEFAQYFFDIQLTDPAGDRFQVVPSSVLTVAPIVNWPTDVLSPLVWPVPPEDMTGPAGPAGPVGPAGPTGDTGPAGPAGADGAEGPAGPGGADGAEGPAGPAGAAGMDGDVGPAGEPGATGPAGPVGPAGATGDTGPAGATGATGDPGASATLSDIAALSVGLAAAGTSADGSRVDHVHPIAVADGKLLKMAAGVPIGANPALDFVSPLITAPVASAATLTLPETGLIVPVTGTATIDNITKPTGNAQRFVILWFNNGAISVKGYAASVPAGTAHISMVVGGSTNQNYSFPANSTLPLIFDGVIWRKFPSGPHWTGNELQGHTSSQALKLITTLVGLQNGSSIKLDLTTAAIILQWGAAGRAVTIDATGTNIINDTAAINLNGRVCFVQGSVASASQVTLPLKASVLVTGNNPISTFVPTGHVEGVIYWLEFAEALAINCNSGGTNDFVSKDGTATINTTPGMVLPFRFDGTDMREVGR